jgi:protein-disulfide isomerase
MAKARKPPPAGGANRNLLIAAGAAAIVVVALVAASLLLRSSDDEEPTPTTPADIGALFEGIPQDRAVLGSPDARVTLIQFEDLQCPVCKRYQTEGFQDVVEQYVRPGRVKLRFVGMAFIGADSEKALNYVLAAGAQGKLWQLADALFANQGDENSGWVTDDLLQQLATVHGLDWAKLQADASGAAVRQQASSMAAEAEQRKVPGTPWFFVQIGDGEPYEVRPGSFELSEFSTILDDALAG